MSNRLNDIRNLLFATSAIQRSAGKDARKNLSRIITNYQLARIRHDISGWRECCNEAESPYNPHRVRMQRMFLDTVLNEHIFACIEKRKALTMLRKYRVVDQAGREDVALTKLFKSPWFTNFQSYCLDATLFGYSLISLGDVVNSAFPSLSIVPRHHISPDRLRVSSMVYGLGGVNFTEQPYSDWHIWIPTPSEFGTSPCGYGLLYRIAKTEIYLRNNIGYNADFIEVFNQPLRKGTTHKTDEGERSRFEASLRDMGNSAYIILDGDGDTVEFVETKNVGAAYQSYADFERRNEQKISKVLLGHADAIDSIPGKLGGGSGEESPVAQALAETQSKDGYFLENIINAELIPRMRKMGFKIPITYRFEYVNDDEAESFRRREDESNKTTADIAQTLKSAGLQMDPDYFTNRTGIPVTLMQEPKPNPQEESESPTCDADQSKPNNAISNKLRLNARPAMEYNKHFSFDRYLGSLFTEDEFTNLMYNNRIFVSEAKLTGQQASEIIGGPIVDYDKGIRSYGGYIVTENSDDWREAEEVARIRGWEEKVCGILMGIDLFEEYTKNILHLKTSSGDKIYYNRMKKGLEV